jgi:phosphonate transport system substrate-binding protein
LTFGIVPQQSATILAKKWVPLMNLLKEKTGYSIRFATAPDIPTFEKRLALGEYDLAYMNPYHYTIYHSKAGYLAFAKEANKRIKGILVTHVGSKFLTVEDINGEVIAFPAPAAFAATLLPVSYLDKNGIEYTPKYVSSHDSVYRAVAGGFATAGGGIYRTFNGIDGAVRSQLKVIWASKGHTPHAFAAHPKVDTLQVNEIQNALIELGSYAAGKTVLSSINMKAIEGAKDGDWDDVRALNIKILRDKNK